MLAPFALLLVFIVTAWSAVVHQHNKHHPQQPHRPPARPTPHQHVTHHMNRFRGSMPATKETTLICTDKHGDSYQIGPDINATIGQMSSFGFGPDCPCPLDPTGKCRQAAHMCMASNQSFFCTFQMSNILITNAGALLDSNNRMISMGHTTVAGEHKPQYFPEISKIFLHGYQVALTKYVPEAHPPTKDIVVPLRMRWDDCFNHLSFQAMPLIGMIHDLHPDLWPRVSWHASRFAAALLILLDVPQEKIVVEKNVRAKQVILPWTQYYNPLANSIPKGIARNASLKLTKNLLAKQFPADQLSSVKHMQPWNYAYQPMNMSAIPPEDRIVVYFNRSKWGSRTVENEVELLKQLQENLRPGLHLVVLGPTKEYKTIEQLLVVWQQYARVVNRAILMIGPHGGGMNNMMWAPDDCDLVEFTEYPDDATYLDSHGQTPVRPVFMSAFYTRSGPNNTYYNIAAIKKWKSNFYEGKMRVRSRDVFRVLAQLKGGTILRDNDIWKSFKDEKPSLYT